MVNKKNNTNDNEEAPFAAGMNFDPEDVEPFLKHYHPQYWIQVLVKMKSIQLHLKPTQ